MLLNQRLNRHALWGLLPLATAITLGVGCSKLDDDGSSSLPPDPEEGNFLNTDAKDDAQGFKEGSWEGACVLRLVNSASEAELREVIHSWPAENIYTTRIGPDGVEGTADDEPYTTLSQLDSVRWVGYFTFRRLLRHAENNGYCPGIGEEDIYPNEDHFTEAVTERFSQFVREKYDEEGFARRDAHAKSHGCVKAFVDVDNTLLDADDRIGFFAQNRTYPAWIRFSNGSPIMQPDNERDARGMAIKVMEVEGEKLLERHRHELTQDFLLINGSTFIVRTPEDYVRFSELSLDGSPISYFLSLNPLEWKIRELANLLRIAAKKPSSPITQYWSTTPYALGEGKAVKYSAKPCTEPETGWPRSPDDDFLRDALVDELSSKDACFDFMVQYQLHAGGMPIEDSTINWDESDSPFIKVATIRIPAQTFDSPAQNEFCENLSFNPWHSLPEHRPLGSMNRMRKIVYDTTSSLRLMLNQAQRFEPTSHDISTIHASDN